ncbi:MULTISPECIES: ML domain-containing protein [Butyricimonas]|uniref:hypothetical protein n=1 Tax=Butyricimonas TaxID=574697 RepID=UPI0007FB372B|nr:MULTISPECIES: hypothetical protein [Butyricimonas]
MKKLTFIIVALFISICNVMSVDMRFADFGSQEGIIDVVNIEPNDDPYIFQMKRGNTYYLTIKFRPTQYIYGIEGESSIIVQGVSLGITPITDIQSNTTVFIPSYGYTIYLTIPARTIYPPISGILKINIKDTFTGSNVLSFGLSIKIS